MNHAPGQAQPRIRARAVGELEAVAGSEYRGRGGDLRLPEAAESEADIVEFRARESVAVIVTTAGDEHLAVGQERRRMEFASGGEAAGGTPCSARQIVEFRAREREETIITACDEHFAVGQQRRRVALALGGEAAGGRPGPARRIVEFRAREKRCSGKWIQGRFVAGCL